MISKIKITLASLTFLLFVAQGFLFPLSVHAIETDARQRGDALVRDLAVFAKSPEQEFRIAKGDYLITPRANRFHLVLNGLRSKKIIATGARLIFADPQKGGILLDGASGLSLEGGELTWQIRPFVAGKVDEVGMSGGAIKILVSPYSEYSASVKELERAPGVWATLHSDDGKRKLTPWRDVIWLKLSSILPSGQLELSVTPNGMPGAKYVRKGDVLVTVARYPDAHALLIHRSSEVIVDGTIIRMSPGMGIVATPGTSNLTIQNTVIRGGDPKSWISTVSDGIHLVGTTGSTIVRNNTVDSTQDDAIVVSERGSWAAVKGGFLEFKDDGTTALSTAEDFLIFPEKGEVTVLKKPEVSRGNGDLTRITFQLKAVGTGDGGKIPVFPVRTEKSAVVIEGNRISSIRGIGIRVCRPGVAVRGNTVNVTVEQAIAAGTWLHPVWLPQMPAIDVEIEANTIVQPVLDSASRDLRGAIEVGCWPLSWCAGRSPNGNVSIRNNRFENGTGYARERLFVLQ